MTRGQFGIQRYVLVLGLLVGALVALALYRDWVIDVLVVRLAYFVWLVGLFIRSRPQLTYWALPVVFGAGIGVLVLAANFRQGSSPALEVETLGRAADWDRLLDSAETQPFFRKLLRRRLEALLAEAAAMMRRGSEPQEIDIEDAGVPGGPTEIRLLLDTAVPQLAGDGADAGGGAWKPEAVGGYLERMLEGGNDR